ncbi:MAG: DUF1573 domain-containing protein [Flavobacteriales bacterium]
MKETIKIALLAIIAVTLIVNTMGQRGMIGGGNTDSAATMSSAAATPGKAAITPAENTFDPLAKEAEPVDLGPKTTMKFGNYDHDFGNVNQDSENTYVFNFTNTGSEPLIIQSATGSCGCTVPEYPKEPIAPGAKGEIKVVYKPGKQKDAQQKTVTVVANTEPKQTTLRISANVKEVVM